MMKFRPALLALLPLIACASEAPLEPATDTQASALNGDLKFFGFDAAWEDTHFAPAFETNPGPPALASWGPNRLDLFERVGQTLQQRSWSPAGWAPVSSWQLVNSDVISNPSASAALGNHISIVWRNSARAVTYFHWEGGPQWISDPLDGIIDGEPSIVDASDGSRRDVFARVGSTLWHRGWLRSNNMWDPNWESLNLSLDGDPVAVSAKPGTIDVFYRANDGSTNRYGWDGTWPSSHSAPIHGTPTGYLAGANWKAQPLGGLTKFKPAAVAYSGDLQVFVQGLDDRIYSAQPTANGWSWATVGNACTLGTPAATSWTPAPGIDARVDLVARDQTSGSIFHIVEQPGASTAAGPVPQCCGGPEQLTCPVPAYTRLVTRHCDVGLGRDSLTGTCETCGRAGDVCCTEDGDQSCNGQRCGHSQQFDINYCEAC